MITTAKQLYAYLLDNNDNIHIATIVDYYGLENFDKYKSIISGVYNDLRLKGITANQLDTKFKENKLDELIHTECKSIKSDNYKKFKKLNLKIGETCLLEEENECENSDSCSDELDHDACVKLTMNYNSEINDEHKADNDYFNSKIHKIKSLTEKEWFDFGYEFGQIRNEHHHLVYLIGSRFDPKSKFRIQMLVLETTWLSLLRFKLTRAICKAYPKHIKYLPGIDIEPSHVFYRVGYIQESPPKYEKNHNQVFSNLEYDRINKFINKVENFVTSLNNRIFDGSFDFMNKMIIYIKEIRDEFNKYK